MHPTHDTDSTERLAGVEHVERHRVVVIRSLVLRGTCTDIDLIDDEQWRSEFGCEVAHVATSDAQGTVCSAFGRPRPDVVDHGYIRSGADTPHRSRPFAITCRVAPQSHNRATCTGSNGSSPRGSTRQLS